MSHLVSNAQALAMYVTETAIMNAANVGSTLLAASDAYIATVGFATFQARSFPVRTKLWHYRLSNMRQLVQLTVACRATLHMHVATCMVTHGEPRNP